MKNPNQLFLAALAVLVLQLLNLTVIGPTLVQSLGDGLGNTLFAVLRIGLIFAFSVLATYRFGLNRFRAIAWSSLLEFVCQVPAKGIWIHSLASHDPAAWGNPDFSSLALGLGMGYALFFPLIFGLSFLGAELGLKLSGRNGA